MLLRPFPFLMIKPQLKVKWIRFESCFTYGGGGELDGWVDG